MLYYSFVYSRLTYGITAWGTTAQNQLREIEVKLNDIIRTMTWNKKFSYVSQQYKKLGFLKHHDVFKLELAKFTQNYVIITSQQLTKFMIMQLENQVDLITFDLEFLNLLDRIKSNLEVLNYGKKLQISENLKNKPFNSFKKQLKENLLWHYWPHC